MPHPYIRTTNTVYAYSIIRFLSCKILFIIQSDVYDVAEKGEKCAPSSVPLAPFVIFLQPLVPVKDT